MNSISSSGFDYRMMELHPKNWLSLKRYFPYRLIQDENKLYFGKILMNSTIYFILPFVGFVILERILIIFRPATFFPMYSNDLLRMV